jgi:hypothetical protein
LSGYVVNKYGATATRVKLLVERLDSAGRLVAQRVEWLGDAVPVFSLPAPGDAAGRRLDDRA